MKLRVKIKVPVTKRGLFGRRKTVLETRVMEVDERTFRRMVDEGTYRIYKVEEIED